MSNIIPFDFQNHEVRVVMENDEPLFVAKDVAEALEYVWAASATIGHVPDEWKGVKSVLTPSGTQQMLVFTEQGLYFFVGRSDKPKALPFQKWIAGEVVPSIRKTGSYATQPMSLAQQALINAQALVEMENRQKQLEANQEKLLKASQGMWTKLKTVDESVDQRILEKLDRFWDNTKNLSATDVGRQLRGVSAQEVNRCAAYLGWIDPIFKDPNNPKKGIDGWELQEEGRLYASQRFDNNGHPVSPVFYGKEAVEQIRALRNSRPNSAWCLTQIIARYERRQRDNAA